MVKNTLKSRLRRVQLRLNELLNSFRVYITIKFYLVVEIAQIDFGCDAQIHK